MTGQPRHGVITLQALGANAPKSAANLAPALGVAHARVIAIALDAIRRRFAQTHAVEGIGPPSLDDRVRPGRPLGGGGRGHLSAPATG
jgi:hypothetical protein